MKISAKQNILLGYFSLRNLTCFFGNKKLDPPVIIWILTHRCNFQCKHCVSWHDNSSFEAKRLMETAKKIADSKSLIVNLSGGELFLVPNITEIISVLKKAGKIVSINTNAWFLDKYIDFIIEQDIDSISVSMDGYNSDIHDNLRKKGSFDRIISNLEKLKNKRKNKKPHIGIRGVVMRENFSDVEKYIERFVDLADDIKFQPVHNYTDSMLHAVTDGSVLFLKEQEEELKRVFLDLGKKYKFMKTNYHQMFPRFIFNPQSMKNVSPIHCIPVLFFSLKIEPDGSCYTCSKKVGNINEQSLSEIWSSKERREFLKNLTACGSCETPCWLNSNVISSETPGKVLKFFISKGL
ncbi:MAG: hypothetical protein QG567_975 [Campylobacterota bacterium]|nr:hypothetical protein [Campylobacterota bacterium]